MDNSAVGFKEFHEQMVESMSSNHVTIIQEGARGSGITTTMRHYMAWEMHYAPDSVNIEVITEEPPRSWLTELSYKYMRWYHSDELVDERTHSVAHFSTLKSLEQQYGRLDADLTFIDSLHRDAIRPLYERVLRTNGRRYYKMPKFGLEFQEDEDELDIVKTSGSRYIVSTPDARTVAAMFESAGISLDDMSIVYAPRNATTDMQAGMYMANYVPNYRMPPGILSNYSMIVP